MIRVYWNVRLGCWSILSDGLVVGHASMLWLRNVTPVVSEAGRLRVRREGRKNVHAYLQGELGGPGGTRHSYLGQITYNPYHDETFRLEGKEYKGSHYVKFENRMARAYR